MAQTDASYPVQFSVDYPDRELNRVTTAFRIIWVIPIAAVLALLSGGGPWGIGYEARYGFAVGGSGLLFIPILLMILFRQKYPRWWFDWNLQLMRFGARVGAYLALLATSIPQPTKNRRSTLISHIRT